MKIQWKEFLPGTPSPSHPVLERDFDTTYRFYRRAGDASPSLTYSMRGNVKADLFRVAAVALTVAACCAAWSVIDEIKR